MMLYGATTRGTPVTDDSQLSEPTEDVSAVDRGILVAGLNIYYGDFRAVADVDMHIESRSITALIGPSGCGKSTFLRSLNRMHEVIDGARVEGSVTLDGADLYAPGIDPVAVRRRVGMVFQRPNPFPTMSIYDNVVAGIRLNSGKLRRSETDEIVERSLRPAGLGALRRPAATVVYRAGHGCRTRCSPDG